MNEIQIQNAEKVVISLAPDAIQLRDGILSESRAIAALADSDTERQAIAVVGRMNGYAKALESCRKQVKAPVLALGKKIDAIAEAALEEVSQEKARISGMLAEAEAKRQAIIREQEEARRNEQERLAAEAAALEEKARKEREEAERKLARARSEKAIQQQLYAQQEREAEIARQKAELLAKQASASVPVAEPAKAAGSIVREVYEVEVFDVAAVFKWNPLYVNLVPNMALLKTAAARGVTDIPGCRIRKETKVSVRAS